MHIDVLGRLEKTRSIKERQRILAEACEDPLTLDLLKWALNPDLMFHLSVNRSQVMAGLVDDSEEEAILFGTEAGGAGRLQMDAATWWQGLEGAILRPLSQRQITGNAARQQVYAYLAKAPSPEAADWAVRILNKDLDCGVGAKMLNNVIPGAVPIFAVALAAPLFHLNGELAIDLAVLEGLGYLEPKIDGQRCIIKGGVGMSRYGHEILGDGIDPVVKQLRACVARRPKPFNRLEHYVFDGELVGEGTFEQSIGQIRTHGKLVFHVFDVMRDVEWRQMKSRPFFSRRRELEALIPEDARGLVQLVPSQPIYDASLTDLIEARDEFRKLGYEGAMWKRGVSRYSFKRSLDIIKVKPFETMDARVVGWYRAREDTKYDGLLGGITIDVDGVEVDCGGPFKDTERAKWKDGPDFSWAEVAFQNKTAKGSLRHPTFIRPRYDKRED